MRRWFSRPFGSALIVSVLALSACRSSELVEDLGLPVAPEGFFYKGVNFTAEGPHPYPSARAAETLEKLPAYGVNAIALVPYGATALGSSQLRFPLRWERDEGVIYMAKVARSLGLRVMLKPQVWVRGGYPGDLEFDNAEAREEWFGRYREFVEHYAKLATVIQADVFCVGVEFAKLSKFSDEWRSFIALARTHYDGPLTYAANFGEEFESVTFWDGLDYIGLDNYYPLADDLSTDVAVGKIEAVYREYGLPVLFTEAGFSTYELAYLKPWEDRPGGELSPEAQARYYQAVFGGFYDKPWLHGIFWWKVGSADTGGPTDGSHQPWGKPAMDVVRRWYQGDAR